MFALTPVVHAQTAHCFNDLNGPEVPCTPRTGGSGQVAPAPSGPSPAEIAAQRQRAAALELDKRAHAAFDRHDVTNAAQLFEQAAQLAPNDTNIQGNRWYTKGRVAFLNGDFAAAISYYKTALHFFPGKKDIIKAIADAHDVPEIIQQQQNEDLSANREDWARAAKAAHGSATEHYYLGRKAIADADWGKGIRELTQFKPVAAKLVAASQEAVRKIKDIEARSPRDELESVRFYLEGAKADLAKYKRFLAETTKYLKMALERKAQQDELKIAEAQHEMDEQRRDQASNPNYPKPPPIYRDDKTPRSYPDLKSYTPAQRAAHTDNDTGNAWAQTGEWVQALLSYQRALTEDPDGPFARVIKDNLAIAMSHLGPHQPQGAPAGVGVIPAATPASSRQDEPKDVAKSNCTSWVSANGKSSRVCMDEQAHRYCEESSGNSISRVRCQ